MPEPGFQMLPAQVRHLLFDQTEIRGELLVGFEQGWAMPLALWRAREGFDASYRSHPHGSLSFVRHGAPVERMDGRFAGRKGGLHPESFMLYPGDEPRRYIARADIGLCHIYFTPAQMQDTYESDTQASATGLELRNDRVLAHDAALRAIVDDYLLRARDEATPSKLEMDARSLLLAVHLLHHHSNRARAAPCRKRALAPRRLRSVVDYLEAHLPDDVSLARLSEIAGLSPGYLCTAFKASTGLAPHQYVLLKRIERSKLLLLGQQPLASVALACGFSSQQHYSTCFRRIVGSTPGIWRRLNQQ